MPRALSKATLSIGEDHLSSMVLTADCLPAEMNDFQTSKDSYLDNATMAEHGFPGSTTGEIEATGRISGYIREYVTPSAVEDVAPGDYLMAATVVHLFEEDDQVSLWIANQFLGEFQRSVRKDLGRGQQIVKAEPTSVKGFSDDAVALCTVQSAAAGLVASTIVDFRVGRLLGVAYVVTMGEDQSLDLAQALGLRLEERMIRVVLGAA